MTRNLGVSGSKAVADVAALFMAAIAVVMIRSGIEGMVFSRERVTGDGRAQR